MSSSSGIRETRKDYWDDRGRLSYKYRGETFYTVTAIPYYWKRRQLLLDLVNPYIGDSEIICDFGCGDGWYLKYFSDQYAGKQWHGVDLSESMIDQAMRLCPEASLKVSSKGIPFENTFDLIYSVAVFAHVLDDQEAGRLFKNIRDRLKPGGHFLVFEQIAPTRYQGDWWCRRTSDQYAKMAENSGLKLEERTLITFSAHRFFERHIARHYIRHLSAGANHAEKCINANRSRFYRALSSLMLFLSLKPVRMDNGKTFGNTLFVFKNQI